MNKSAHSFQRYNQAALISLVSTLGMLAGCSGGDTPGVDPKAISESELVLIESTAKTPQDVKKALRAKVLESEGVVLPTKTAGKAIKKGR